MTKNEEGQLVRDALGIGADFLSYKQIMRKADEELNDEQKSIKYKVCVSCGEGYVKGNRTLASSRNGHQCWIHSDCR